MTASTAAALRRAAGALLDLVLPRACAACERTLDAGDRDVVCGRCWARLQTLPHPHCPRCGHPTWARDCRWCALLPPYVRAARSVCWTGVGTGSDVVHALKYAGWRHVAEGMAERMARLAWPRDVVEERAALVPVPLSGTRLRERGFNQSALLAAALARRWQVPARDDVLGRVRATASQTRLTPGERVRNVSGAFRAVGTARDSLRGAHVVLVDDVVTTAATLNACAAALVNGGARIVSYVTFGRAPALGDRC
ncbi:MAG TPA: double zinc ribbon domain-containing protein [Gemmatimonadaceae bacterium]|nr:double zinc ribbon domain-containing protein [Gemmatimonadaceae bacterium]